MAESPLELLEEALNILGDDVHLDEANGPSSHTAILVTQLGDAAVTSAIGRYLVGVIGGAVQHDARLSEALLPTGGVGREDSSLRRRGRRRRYQRLQTEREIYFLRPRPQRMDR